jgi:hypothetical protein
LQCVVCYDSNRVKYCAVATALHRNKMLNLLKQPELLLMIYAKFLT